MKKRVSIALTIMLLSSGLTIFSQNETREKELKAEIALLKEKNDSFYESVVKAKKKELKQLEAKDVSDFTKQQFAIDFGHVGDVTWKHLEDYDGAIFENNDGVQTKALYDIQSNLIGTVLSKTLVDFPDKVQNIINENYGDYEQANIGLFEGSGNNELDFILNNEPFPLSKAYFIELTKNGKVIVLGFNESGDVVYRKDLKQ